MTPQEFDNIITGLLVAGLDITLSLRDGTRWYDLNTMMKSDLRIALVDDIGVWAGRYDAGEFHDIDDLRRIGQDCMCGRDYASGAWFDFMKEEPNALP